MLQATKRYHDSHAVILMRAAAIVQKEIFQKQYRFEESLLDEQYDDKPSSLLALVQMILGGTNIENQMENNNNVKCSALSITQLLVFNAVECSRKDTDADNTTLIGKPDFHSTSVFLYTSKLELIEVLFNPLLHPL